MTLSGEWEVDGLHDGCEVFELRLLFTVEPSKRSSYDDRHRAERAARIVLGYLAMARHVRAARLVTLRSIRRRQIVLSGIDPAKGGGS